MTKQPAPNDRPIVGIVMGSDSDWPVMEQAAKALDQFGVSWEATVASAHRTPERVRAWVDAARHKNYHAIIVGAGAAAHLGGVIAAECNIPVIGVPIEATSLNGLDALLSIVQMPAGVPVATMAIGKAGATNAALMAVAILGNTRPALRAALQKFRQERADQIMQEELTIGY